MQLQLLSPSQVLWWERKGVICSSRFHYFFEICTIKLRLTFHQALFWMLESGQWHRVPLILLRDKDDTCMGLMSGEGIFVCRSTAASRDRTDWRWDCGWERWWATTRAICCCSCSPDDGKCLGRQPTAGKALVWSCCFYQSLEHWVLVRWMLNVFLLCGD